MHTLDGGCTSIRKYYEKWLPTLDEQKVKSNDLLDQILFCFTIKRALNGDNKAIDKLSSLYEGIAVSIAWKMANARKLTSNYDTTSQL